MLWGWMRFQANGIISTYPGLRWVHLALGWRAGSDGCGECGANGLVSPKSWFHTGQYSVRGVVLDPGESWRIFELKRVQGYKTPEFL